MESGGGSMKIAAIGDEDTLALLRLAGVEECYSNEEKFDELVNDGDVAILIMTYEFVRKLQNKIFQHRLMKDMPIIVEIPSKKEVEREDTIKRLIVRAVGVEVE